MHTHTSTQAHKHTSTHAHKHTQHARAAREWSGVGRAQARCGERGGWRRAEGGVTSGATYSAVPHMVYVRSVDSRARHVSPKSMSWTSPSASITIFSGCRGGSHDRPWHRVSPPHSKRGLCAVLARRGAHAAEARGSRCRGAGLTLPRCGAHAAEVRGLCQRGAELCRRGAGLAKGRGSRSRRARTPSDRGSGCSARADSPARRRRTRSPAAPARAREASPLSVACRGRRSAAPPHTSTPCARRRKSRESAQ